ncbi:MAG: sigma-54 dependent transcriptional regulator [Gemmatimonadales bacterium]
MSDRVLITMDDLEVAVPMNAAFERAGFTTEMVSSLDDVRTAMRRTEPDVVILTGGLHERPAADLTALAREARVSTFGLIEPTEPDPRGLARELGLTAWSHKPFDATEAVAVARRLIERRKLQQRTGILGESPAVQEVLVKIEQMAPVTSTVLIEGESGTGKELVAQAMHTLSPRRNQPFIAVSCAALPETLLESELFGHEKGSFTGAAERRLGRFELADGGTLFLDEVGEMPPSVQVKLLRVLESRQFFRVGGTQPIRVDVRVIAATNRGVKQAVVDGAFRDDLYYRLNVLNIYLPPLRERKMDIPLLIRTFVADFAKAHGREFRGITPDAMEILVNAHWPGNVRQLRNLIESMVVLAPGREIRPSDIPSDVREGGSRLLPMPIARVGQEPSPVGHQQLEFIFRTLVELKRQIEDLRHRADEREDGLMDIGHLGRGGPVYVAPAPDVVEEPESGRIVYRPGMRMAEIEKAAIEAALEETRGNRRKAAEQLGIGERTLYRKIREFGLG